MTSKYLIDQSSSPEMTIHSFLDASFFFIEDLVEQNTHLFYAPQKENVLRVLPLLAKRWFELHDRIAVEQEYPWEQHGLSGEELALKIDMLSSFMAIPNIFDYRSIVRKTLEMIDTILGSVIDTIGASGAAAELKQMIESSFDDSTNRQ